MEFNRLLSQVIANFGEPNLNLKTQEKSKDNFQFDLKKYKLIENLEELNIWIKKIEKKGLLVIDTETTSINPHDADLVGISLCTDIGTACYIPLKHSGKKNIDIKLVLKKLKPILEDPSIKKIGQNIKFDYIILSRHEINIGPIDDTMLMSYVLDAGKNRHNMDILSEIHLGHKTIQFKDIAGTGKKQINFSQVPLDKATEYSGEDADVTYRLYDLFNQRLKEEKIVNLYETLEKPMIKILSKMEGNGIKINISFLKNLSNEFNIKIDKIEKNIFKISKKNFNIGSPKQLGEILYNELKLSALKKTKKGSFATSAAVLEDLAYKGHELPKLVLDWRQLTKLKNTYTDSLPTHLNSKTNRIHTSFLLAATTTGRLASSDPNLQNIPIKTDDGKQIRKAFIADKDHILLSADYNQIEMRILADIADVKQLKKAFLNKEDIHSLTASQVFNIPLNKIDKETRRRAKAINFGIIYGISQYGLAKQLSVSNQEASEFLKLYFKKFPEIKDYMNTTINFCRKSGYVKNIFGRKCHITGINDKNFNVRNFQERAAINAPIQGSAADIMRLAMIKIDKILSENIQYKTKMLLQIHDELIFELYEKNLNNILPIIKNAMTSVSQSDQHIFSIPLIVDVNSGKNWGEVK